MAAHRYTPNAPRTLGQHKRLFALLGKMRLDDEQRHELVAEFTNGRTNSSKSMLAHECNSLIHRLEQQLNGTEGEKLYNMRRKVFSLAHELGWENADGSVNRDRLNAWLLKYGAAKKQLLELTVPELRNVVTQMERINTKQQQHG